MTFTTYQAALRLYFSGRVSMQLWAQIIALYFAFPIFLWFMSVADGADEPTGATALLIAVVLLVWLGFALWIGWRLSRALTVGENVAGGSFGGWFKWSLISGLPGALVTGLYEVVAGSNAEWWLSALIGAVIGALVLPTLVHALVRAANNAYIPSAWTFREGKAYFYPLVSASMLWLIPSGLLNGYFIEMTITTNSDNIGIMAAFAVGSFMVASLVIQGGLAAVGYHQLPSVETDVRSN